MTDHIWGIRLAVACIKDSHDLPEIWFFQRSWLILAASMNYKFLEKLLLLRNIHLTCLSYACCKDSMGTSPDGLPASQVSVSQMHQNKGGKVQGRVRVFSEGLSSHIPSKAPPTVQAPPNPHPALAALSAPDMLCSLMLSTCPSSRTSSAQGGCYPHGKFPAGLSLASWSPCSLRPVSERVAS